MHDNMLEIANEPYKLLNTIYLDTKDELAKIATKEFKTIVKLLEN